MNGRLIPTFSMFTIAAVLALGATGLARGEVWVELDGQGQVVGTHVPAGHSGARLWRATGEAPARSQVLNTEGATRGDGRPDIAVDPRTGLPRAVWAMRSGGGFDIVTSSFDGHRWSDPIGVTGSFGVDDLDPRIAFRFDGLALVTWWTNAGVPGVQLAYLPHGGNWAYSGLVSAPTEPSKLPAIRQAGSLTIVAYRTPSGLRIATFTNSSTDFGDGPTPFPRDTGNNGPMGDEPPAPVEP